VSAGLVAELGYIDLQSLNCNGCNTKPPINYFAGEIVIAYLHFLSLAHYETIMKCGFFFRSSSLNYVWS